MQKTGLSENDRKLLDAIASGNSINNLQDGSNKYRELATGILLQYADSEMAGAAGYALALPWVPSLPERVELSRITYEKLALAQRAYTLAAQSGINVDKYISSHSWEARLHRNVSLGYRRGSADKRVNALMYPLQGWADLTMFTYLMASMACLQLEDFSKSSFQPWAALASSHLRVEESHRDFGLECVKRQTQLESELPYLQLSMRYWFEKVLACFGPEHSERNAMYLEFGLKKSKNEQLSSRWESEVCSTLSALGI